MSHTLLYKVDIANEAEMSVFASAFAPLLQVGDVVLLGGDLGAGKTVFARSVVQTLYPNILEVPSPTFNLVNMYGVAALNEQGALPLWHFDLYRVEDASELLELGMEDAKEEGVMLVEWAENAGELGAELFGEDSILIKISHLDESSEKRIISVYGNIGWQSRLQSAFKL